MKHHHNYKWMRPALFVLGGALVGLAVYFLAEAVGGSSVIASNPVRGMIYLGLAGWLLSHSHPE